MVVNQLSIINQGLNIAIVECNDPKMQLLSSKMKSSTQKYGDIISFNDLKAILAFK